MKNLEKELKYLRQVLEEYEFTFQEILQLLDWSQKKRKLYKQIVNSWEEDGEIYLKRNGKYTLPEKEGFLRGEISIGNGNFGFLDIPGEKSVFIPGNYLNTAMNGDTVLIRILKDSKSPDKSREGEVYKIVKRDRDIIVGVFEKSMNFGFVRPKNAPRDIYISKKKTKGAKTGDLVAVKIYFWGDSEKKPEGEVVSIIGNPQDTQTLISALLIDNGIQEKFSNEVIKEIDRIEEDFSEELEKRKDLRHLNIVTIDGADAKDLDDAITLERDGENWRLGVHIADVSHYVRENTALDREAFARGTSIYLVDRVIPMLPHRLSNGICSLNEGVDRLALSCIMDINHRGEIIGHQIAETLIRVNHRMSYTEVNAMITHHDQDTIEKYAECVEMFENMKELADLIRKKRVERGSIDFDFPECKILLDEKGSPIEIKAYERNAANMLIEDFMLAANETVAEEYYWLELPFLYRVHDTPDPEKIQQLATFIQNFGYTLHAKNKEVHPKEVQKLLAKIAGEEVEMMISRVTLRSMKQARYQTECTGHFGLAAKYYTHFTSPIRRYPDLQIHRIIKENLAGKLNQSRQKHYSEHLEEVAVQTSVLERRAQEAERETIKYKKCEYMQKYIGQVFDGIICGVTRYGLYVELPNTVEGLVHIQAMWQDYFVYVEERHMLIGETTNIKYTLGQRVKVRVMAVDRLMGTIDFRLEMEGEEDEWLME